MHHIMNSSRISTNMNKDNDVCDRILRSVICRVERFEVTRSHRKSVLYMVVSMVTLVALIPAIYYIYESISMSGFGQYFSLISSDGSYMLTNWQEFVLSMASSLPLTGAMVSLFILFVTMYAMRRTVNYEEYSQNIKKRLIAT